MLAPGLEQEPLWEPSRPVQRRRSQAQEGAGILAAVATSRLHQCPLPARHLSWAGVWVATACPRQVVAHRQAAQKRAYTAQQAAGVGMQQVAEGAVGRVETYCA